MVRARRLAAIALLAALASGCGATHPAGGTQPGVKAVKQKKLAVIAWAVAHAEPPTHVVAKGSPCAGGSWVAWSPDGTQIAWAGRHALCLARPDGTDVQPLAHTRDLTDDPTQLVWLRSGALLYGANYQVYVIRPGGAPAHLSRAQADSFSVSADGTRFALPMSSDCPDCTGPVTVWSLDGALLGTVGGGKFATADTSLSRDGSQVAFVRETSGSDGGVWVARSDGSDLHQLDASGGLPLWSPTADTIAYGSNGGLVLASPDGGQKRILVRTAGTPLGWSPDGKLLAFDDASWRLSVVDVATGKVRQLDARGAFYGATWSPDSRELLVFARVDNRCNALWQVPVDGSKPALLSSCY